MSGNKKGLSLVVLLITIIVMIIISGVVIASFSKNSPVKAAKEARFKADVSGFASTLSTYHSEQIKSNSNYKKSSLNIKFANATGSTSFAKENYHFDQMVKVIPEIEKKYTKKLEIDEGFLVYRGTNKNEIKWADEVNLGKIPKAKNDSYAVIYDNAITSPGDIGIINVSQADGEDGTVMVASRVHEADFQYAELRRYGPSGKLLMVQDYPLNYYETNCQRTLGITKLRDGNYVLNGLYSDKALTYTKQFVVKVDKDGKKIWEKRIQEPNAAGNYYEVLNGKILETKKGELMVPGGRQTGEPTLTKLDSKGNVIFEKVYPRINLHGDLHCIRDIKEEENCFVLLTGNTEIMLVDKTNGDVIKKIAVFTNADANKLMKLSKDEYAVVGKDDSGGVVGKLYYGRVNINTSECVTKQIAGTYGGVKAMHASTLLGDGTICVATDGIRLTKIDAYTADIVDEKTLGRKGTNLSNMVLTNEDVVSIEYLSDGTITIVGATFEPGLLGLSYKRNQHGAAFVIKVNTNFELIETK